MSGCAVIGIGNILMSDEGVGVHAARYLEGELPHDVELLEGAVYGMDLLPYLEGRDKVIFIDAIDAGDEPGAVFRFSPWEVKRDRNSPSVSVHDLGLFELISAARVLDHCPDDLVVIAVQVGSMEVGMELSREVRGSLPHVRRLVLEELNGK
ncbi:MAG: HyaD/HybD family hydrogenase maturation endopeptidase [Actinobacteria bacterium]|nr:HyaD/HybD family hydrogenase maturation endopeptidase [Actinomycetota bacterium]